MTEPFGRLWKRRRFLKTSLLSAGAILPATNANAAGSCDITPSTEDGPLYPAEEIPFAADLTQVDGQPGAARGQVVFLFGQVKSAECHPVANATVETWQADDKGYYRHPRHTAPEGLDPAFAYFGKVRTDGDGQYLIKTIVPSWYRIFNIDRAAHIHIKARSPSHGVLTSEIYFSGEDQDAIRETDPVFQSRRNKEALIVDRNSRTEEFGMDIPSEDGAAYCRFDIMYRI